MQHAHEQLFLIGDRLTRFAEDAAFSARFAAVQRFDDAADFTHWVDYGRLPARACVIMPIAHAPLSGLDLLDVLRADGVALPMVLLTGAEDLIDAVRTTRYDGVYTLWPPFEITRLIEAIERALDDFARGPGRESSAPASLEDRIATLSPRQRQVLHCVFAGSANRVIADELGISVKTVELHRASMMRKMQADSVIDLIRMLAAYGQQAAGV